MHIYIARHFARNPIPVHYVYSIHTYCTSYGIYRLYCTYYAVNIIPSLCIMLYICMYSTHHTFILTYKNEARHKGEGDSKRVSSVYVCTRYFSSCSWTRELNKLNMHNWCSCSYCRRTQHVQHGTQLTVNLTTTEKRKLLKTAKVACDVTRT
jgi:hypothetical protein